MHMMNTRSHITTLFLAFLLTMPVFLQAQQGNSKDKEPTRGLGVGIMAHSYGFGFDIQYLLLRDNNKTIVISTALSSVKHPTELKIESAYADQGGKNYIYDKKNYGYVLAPTVGLAKDWIPKSGYSRISLRTTFSGGPALALLKPYYLEVAVPINGNQAIVEIDKYDATKYNYQNIVGEADYFLGLNEITVQPGLQAKVSTLVDFAGQRNVIRGFEFAVYANYFANGLDLLELTEDKQLWLGGSIQFLIGNKW